MNRVDRRKLKMYPLSERENKLDFAQIAVNPDDPPPQLSDRLQMQVERAADYLLKARNAGSAVILAFGAHLIKNGLAPVMIRLIEEGFVTHLATNGAGSIHDWEFAYLGQSGEDVRINTAQGRFGTWEETGRYLNLAIAVGGIEGLGYGASIGKLIAEEGICLPSKEELRERIVSQAKSGRADESLGAFADLLHLIDEFHLPEGRMEIAHPHKAYSVQYAAWKQGVPFTVHPGIGYDIIYSHPMCSGGVIGRAADRDFLSYASSVSYLSGGVHLSVGSAIMAPMIFEKALSMANNIEIQEGSEPLSDYYLAVVDIQEGEDWDWSRGEPPIENPAYYLRFCKTFYRMGGTLDYLCLDNRAFLLNLYHSLVRRKRA